MASSDVVVTRERRSVGQIAAAVFTERLPYKAAAVFLSLLLWIVAESREPSEQVVDVALALTLDSTVQLDGPMPKVKAEVIGRWSDVSKLQLLPPTVHPTSRAQRGDSLIVDLEPRDVELQLPPDIKSRVTVRDVQPRTLTLRLVAMDTRRLPVRALLDAPPDSAGRGKPRAAVIEPDSVTVYGPRTVVQQLVAVPTVRRTLELRDTLGVLVALDTSRLGVRVSPAHVRARLSTPRDTLR